MCFQADALEIMLALDNGNVEIYDRYSLQLTHTIVGKHAVSPGLLDMNADLILVEYTASFGGATGSNRINRFEPSSGPGGGGGPGNPVLGRSKIRRSSGSVCQKSWWKLFCRRSKTLLRVIDKKKLLFRDEGEKQNANQQVRLEVNITKLQLTCNFCVLSSLNPYQYIGR